MIQKILIFILTYLSPGLGYPLENDHHKIWNKTNNSLEYNNDRTPRVLNFFPVPVEEECLANDGRRKGVCMNTYECHIQSGKSYGKCALGFGVCCVFTMTCNQEIFNNLTHFINPHFPSLTTNLDNCTIKVKKIDPEISQLRLDFIHFNLGQPNRRNGECEDDIFLMRIGRKKLQLCGLNSGQHMYFDVDFIDEPIEIVMNLNRKTGNRLWEIRVAQIPFSQRAPAGCLQYYTGVKGIIETMNFAENGRHLSNQDYNICMRQEEGMCTIAYEQCDEDSFKIDPNQNDPNNPPDEGSGDDFALDTRQLDEECNDKIILPCDNEDLLNFGSNGFCNTFHCGKSFCLSGMEPCRIESSIIPFTVGVHFGPTVREVSPDDNLGMCLKYEQLPCGV